MFTNVSSKKLQVILPLFVRILKDRYTVERRVHLIADKTHDSGTAWLPYKALIT